MARKNIPIPSSEVTLTGLQPQRRIPGSVRHEPCNFGIRQLVIQGTRYRILLLYALHVALQVLVLMSIS